jgi:hypothetical protein
MRGEKYKKRERKILDNIIKMKEEKRENKNRKRYTRDTMIEKGKEEIKTDKVN